MKDQIETVSTDMWKAFIGAVAKVFPHALMIHDRFHCIQYLNKAINQVRRREVKQHPELKGSRYVLLKNEKNRTKKTGRHRPSGEGIQPQCECRLAVTGRFQSHF